MAAEHAPFSASLFCKWAAHPGHEPDEWGPALDTDAVVAQARRMVTEFGFPAIKFKGGVMPEQQEVEAILTLLREAFPAMPLRLDPNAPSSPARGRACSGPEPNAGTDVVVAAVSGPHPDPGTTTAHPAAQQVWHQAGESHPEQAQHPGAHPSTPAPALSGTRRRWRSFPMKRALSLVSAIVAAVVTAGFTVHPDPAGHNPPSDSASGRSVTTAAASGHWVDTWASMPQLTEPGNMPPIPFTQTDRVFDNATLRQTVHVGVGGQRMRLRFSNAFGGTDLPITAVSVALPVDGRAGVGAIVPDSGRRVTFGGQPGFDIPQGAQAVSDPLDFDVRPGANLTVTLYLARGQLSTSITSHPGSRTTSYMLAGDHLTDGDLAGATTADHWYFLSGLEVWSKQHTSATVVLGDSISDGRGSTTNGNDRWPDELQARLRSRSGTTDIAIINEAAGGNRVLHDGLGPNALSRLDRDVLAQSGVDRLVVFEGVNDIGTAGTSQADAQQITAELIGAYQQIITRAQAQGIRVYGATLTPFGGNTYDDPAGAHESARQALNQWIRTSGRFDAVIDFDRAAGDPDNPRQLLPAYDTGDHLHLNPAGYKALANAVPAALFHS